MLTRWRLVAGVGVVVALAATVLILALRGDTETPELTTPTTMLAAPSTTNTTPPTTTTTASTTSTTTTEQREAEVTELLRNLWFGWFDAIYRKDSDALWQVVATTNYHRNGVAAMDALQFESPPLDESIQLSKLEILLDREDCLVAAYVIDPTDFLADEPAQFVSVMWPDARYGFRFATAWKFANDLWEQDCDILEREVTP